MQGNSIHSTAILEGDVRMGTGNVVGPYCVLTGPLTMGDDNEIGSHTAIGSRGDELQQRRYDASAKAITLGDHCTIREHVTIHKACYGDATVIGNAVFLMPGSYVAHDTILQDGAVLAQNAVVGGVSRVLTAGYVAMGATLHQQAVVGHYAIVAANAAAVRSVRPFSRMIPGQSVTVNDYAIKRYGFTAHRNEIEAYVLAGRRPEDDTLLAIVEEYDLHVTASGRGEHGSR